MKLASRQGRSLMLMPSRRMQMPALVLIYGPDQGGVRDIGQRLSPLRFLGAELMTRYNMSA